MALGPAKRGRHRLADQHQRGLHRAAEARGVAGSDIIPTLRRRDALVFTSMVCPGLGPTAGGRGAAAVGRRDSHRVGGDDRVDETRRGTGSVEISNEECQQPPGTVVY